MTRHDLCNKLMQSGVPAGPVNSVSEALSQPHAKHRRMEVRRDGYRGLGLPVRLKETPGQPGTNPRPFNADAFEVLKNAGYSEQDVERLIDEAIASRKNVY